MNTPVNLLVIDGQGGGIGRQLVTLLRQQSLPVHIMTVGTNALATQAMMKAGADTAATGENAVVVAARTADIIVGPVGIVIADSLYGEVTPTMALAVAQSNAKRILLPFNHCKNLLVGVDDFSPTFLVQRAIDTIRSFLSPS